ncbi:MAG: urease [Kordiimonadales bacterium]|nr:MAG: urease [Kordiimonadales bacterium]
MLEHRPSCENCDKDLPPAATDACICSYECTYCRDCVELLENVCPNCGGGFVPRPVRPKAELRPGVGLGKQPASTKRVLNPIDTAAHKEYAATIKTIPQHER